VWTLRFVGMTQKNLHLCFAAVIFGLQRLVTRNLSNVRMIVVRGDDDQKANDFVEVGSNIV
jgi:hypothetical protein